MSGYRFRQLNPEDADYWRASTNKAAAFQELERRNRLRDGNPAAIPYHLTGRPLRDSVAPTYLNGRLRTTSSGQTRHYLDWELAEQSASPFDALLRQGASNLRTGGQHALKD